MNNELLPVESIQERDVDLILLEELSTDITFCEWLINKLKLPPLSRIDGAWRSISGYGLGETDLLFSYFSQKKRIYILIENKITASFQEQQYKRYEERKKLYLRDKLCDIAYSILIAPQLYCDNQNDFEYFITYEEIIKRLEFTASKRNLFKSQLLKIGAEKLRRGYQPVNSTPVQKFWTSIWFLVAEKYTDFQMKKPGIVPLNSDWPKMQNENFTNVTFLYKLTPGYTDATLKGYSDELKYKLKNELLSGASIVEHRSSFSIRIQSPKINKLESFESQKSKIIEGLNNLNKIKDWLLKINLKNQDLE